jgi:transcriptional regulator with XRE-family HTH domain
MDRHATAACPPMDRGIPYSSFMPQKRGGKDEESTASSTAKVLGANLQALMASHSDLSSNPKLAKKTGLGTGSISRLRNGEVDPTLSTLEKLSKAFDVAAWQLLVPNIDPGNLPALLSASEAERKLWESLRQVAKEMGGGS